MQRHPLRFLHHLFRANSEAGCADLAVLFLPTMQGVECLDNPRGALVRSLIETGPAKEAGIEPGDVIIRFDGKDVKTARDLPLMVAQTPVGKQVRVVVWRDGEEVTVSLSLGLLDEDPVSVSISMYCLPE